MKARKNVFLINLVTDFDTNEVIDTTAVDPDLVTDHCIENCDDVFVNSDLGITYIMKITNEQWINRKLYMKSEVQLRNEKINKLLTKNQSI